MADQAIARGGRREVARRLALRAAKRIARNGWLLAGAGMALLAHNFFAAPSIVSVAVSMLLLALVAVVAPGRAPRPSPTAIPASDSGVLEMLTVERLSSAVTAPLVVFDASGAVVHANAAAQHAFGGLPRGIALQLKFRTQEMQALVEAMRSGELKAQSVEYHERVPVERTFKVNGTAAGSGTGLFVLFFEDQSESRRIDRMRADFIANASHELRTPLASISGFLETLRGPARNDPAAREAFLQIMQAQTARMARLIDDLLSLSRLEVKPYLPPGSRLDLRSVVEAVIELLAPLASASGVIVERDFPISPAEVRGDRDELFQVFQNLLENACTYGQSGGRVIVSIAQPQHPGEVVVRVRDFGQGIAEEHLPRITERFYRVDTTTSRAHKGTGLGLAIVKHILTRHNGWLSVRSRLGEGSEFTVHLPAE